MRHAGGRWEAGVDDSGGAWERRLRSSRTAPSTYRVLTTEAALDLNELGTLARQLSAERRER